ncbi:MAG: GcvT family protein [Pikeienuella sp.]
MSGTIIIGGGAIGLSTAYHLAKRGVQDVVVLERNQLTSGTSWHAAGIVGPLRATPNMTRLASYALEMFPNLEAETGMSTGYRRTGGYWLAREKARLDELHRIADLGTTLGLTPRMIGADSITVPGLETAGLCGALEVPEDANVSPVDLCMAYARAAKERGVEIREGTGVASLLVSGGRATGVVLSDGARLSADKVILCTGAWSRELAATAGVALPLQAVEHMYVVTTPIPGLPDPFPVIRDLDRGIYIKGDAGKLVIGGFEPNAKCWDAQGPEGDRAFLEMPEDWDQFAPFMEAALALMPGLANAGIQHFMNGPESFTADTRPLVGETPEVEGLFVAAGMNSVGIMSSAGIGRGLADWVVDGAPAMDMWEVDIARIDPRAAAPSHMKARMEEAVADLFALHWPYKQPTAGRGLRRTALHDRWKAAGAVFGLTAGWERGLWYAQCADERHLPYSVGAQAWHPVARREAANMAKGAVMLDLSPFTKIRVSGHDALAALNALTTAHIDVPVGHAVYTLFLNDQGGIEIDATITRLGIDEFEVTTGATTRRRDLAYLRRNLPPALRLIDQTEAFCVIGLMGAASRELLTRCETDITTLRFGHTRDAPINNTPCRMTRLSFVGELGYEITVANAGAGSVFDTLRSAGAVPMGHYALEGCRIEKGFKHWGNDIGPNITPLEAGLAFTIDWSKEFRGKDALAQQRAEGIRQRLVLLQIEGNALMLHDEPLFEHGHHVGLTTSGGIGPRTGLNLALALVGTSAGETMAETCARRFMVRVAGRDYAATALRQPPFDPTGERMRA